MTVLMHHAITVEHDQACTQWFSEPSKMYVALALRVALTLLFSLLHLPSDR